MARRTQHGFDSDDRLRQVVHLRARRETLQAGLGSPRASDAANSRDRDERHPQIDLEELAEDAWDEVAALTLLQRDGDELE